MPYPRFEGVIPLGKEIDLLITQHNWQGAIKLLKRAESDLTLRRRRRGNRILNLPRNSKQRKIDETQMNALDKKIDFICATLRGKNGLFWKHAKRRITLPYKPQMLRRR